MAVEKQPRHLRTEKTVNEGILKVATDQIMVQADRLH